jgi:uridine kinase
MLYHSQDIPETLNFKYYNMLVIGIAGGTGSGKTTVVKEITKILSDSDVVVIPQDSYYKDNSHLPLEQRLELNFDHPDSVDFELLVKHIKKLKEGKPVDQPVYSYLTCSRSETEKVKINPSKVIIIEGILIFTCSELRKTMDIKVFVDADADDRLGRVITRDNLERGRTIEKVLERYEKTVKPMHLQFIEPSKRYADIIVPQGGHNQVAIDILLATIEKVLNKR